METRSNDPSFIQAHGRILGYGLLQQLHQIFKKIQIRTQQATAIALKQLRKRGKLLQRLFYSQQVSGIGRLHGNSPQESL